jgi:hypothetical protein
MIKCPICEFQNEDGALFCEQCKSDLAASDTAALASTSSEAQVESAVAEASAPMAAVAIETAMSAEGIAMAGIAVAEAVPLAEPAPTASPLEAVPQAIVAEIGPVESPSGNHAAESASPEAAPAEAPRLSPDAKPKLVVVRGQRPNAEYLICEGENYIGRSDEDKSVDIDVEDQEPEDRIWSSRQHALLVFKDGQFTIEDLNSTNGTFVNRLRIHPGQKKPLQIKDVIQIGTVQMRLST